MITLDKIIALNYKITNNPNGAIDIPGIESAIKSPFQTFGGKDLISDNIDKIISVFMHIDMTQYFEDGNKRTAFAVLLELLSKEGIKLTLPHDEIIKLVYDVANHKPKDIKAVRERLKI